MLRVNKLPEVLKSVLHDGIEGCVLMTADGSILSSVSIDGNTISETVLAAIGSTVWSNYSSGNSIISLHISKFENGVFGVVNGGSGYLIAAYGHKVTVGMLRCRLDAIGTYFSRVFDQLK